MNTDESEQTKSWSLVIALPTVKRLMFTSIFLVIILGSLANFTIYHVLDSPDSSLANLLQRFDLGHEPSFPNFFSALLILLAATICFANAYVSKKALAGWFTLGCVMTLLAIDENIMFHEMINSAADQLGWKQSAYYFQWTVVGIVFALIVAFVTRGVFREVQWHTSKWFIIGGAVFLAGAVGTENVAAMIFSQAGSEQEGVKTIAHWLEQTVEETLEMTGMAIFISAALNRLVSRTEHLKLTLKP